MLPKFAYQRAGSIPDAAKAALLPKTRILAGGTDLLGCLRGGILEADRLVSLSGIADLKGIRPRREGGLRLGALTTIAEIAENRQIAETYPALAQAAASVASPQLRNQGTLGGNLCQRPRCWYFRGDFHCRRKGGDTCFAETGDSQYHAILGVHDCYIVHPSDTAPALVAYDARVTIAGRTGTRQAPLSAFFVLPEKNIHAENILGPGEFLTEVLLDPPEAGSRGVYRKVRERASFDFALAGAAIVLSMNEGKVRRARIVLSGVAPVPWRAADAEKAIEGKALDAATIAAAAQAAAANAMPLADNGYKVPLVEGILQETLAGLAA
jgi:xanthine dehydrogenase YagS FAD-binding subunit